MTRKRVSSNNHNPQSRLKGILLASSLLLMVGCSTSLPERGADTVLLNGKIYTLDDANPWSSALVIEDNKITYVGKNQGAREMIGKNTRVVDLDEQLVLPGFIDTHAHPMMTAGMSEGVELDINGTPEEWLDAVASYAKDNPDAKGILGFGFMAAAFGPEGPTKEALDEIVSDRPVILIDEGGHSAWVNSKAFELAGVDKNTPDPVAGTHFYQRDKQGNPTGWCLEAMTFMPMIDQLKLVNTESIVRNAENVFYLFNAFGITTVYDAGFSSFADSAYEALDQLAKNDSMSFRLVSSHMIQSPQQLPDAVSTLQQYQQKYSSELVQPRVMKIHNDGTKEALTAGQFHHYVGQPDNFGSVLLEGQKLQDFVKEVDAAGFDIHIHAIGDRAVDEALDAFEAARQSNPDSASRYSIGHTELVRDEDLPRFAELGVIAQTTPYWFATDGEFENQVIGKERAEKLYRFRKIKDFGARVTFGSDFPATGEVTGLAPIVNMEMGQTRKYYGDPEMPVTPPIDSLLTLEEMIRGYTLDAAYQLNMEKDIGSLEVGKFADLVVVDKNLFELHTYDIHNAKVTMTFMNGELVFERSMKTRLMEWMLGM